MSGLRAAQLALMTAALAAPAAYADPASQPAPAAPTSTAAAAGQPAPPSAAELQWRKDNAEVMRLAEANEGGFDRDAISPGDEEALPSLGGALLKMFLVLGGVCLLAYLLLGKVLPRLLRVPTPSSGQKVMRVVDRLPIDQRRTILIVAVGDQFFMVGATDGGIQLLSRLDADTIEGAMSKTEARTTGLARLAEALVGRGAKEG